MPKGLKIFLITLLIIFTLLGSIFIYAYQNIDALKKYALQEVNQMLNAELTAQSIDVTVFNTFPKVSLALNEVRLEDPIHKGKYVLEAQHLFLGFDLYDVINSRYNIQLLDLDSGKIFLFTDKKGITNFDLLKDNNPNPKKKKAFSFNLNKLELNRMQVQWIDESSNFKFNTYIEESTLSGSFNEKKFVMDLALKGNSKEVQSGNMRFFKDKIISIKSSIAVDQEKNKFQLQNAELGINQLVLAINGFIENNKNETIYQLSFKGNKISIQDLLSTLPFQLPEAINAYQSSGKVYFEGSFNGKMTAQTMPQLKLNFGIEQGALIEPDSKMKLDQIQLQGSFDNGSNGNLKDAQISISNMQAQLAGSQLKANLLVQNLESPLLTLELNGDADLKTLHTFFKFSDISEIDGNILFTLNLKGEKNGANWNWESPMNKGIFELNLNKIKINYLSKVIENAKIKAELNNNQLQLAQAEFTIGKSDFHLQGKLPGFMDFLFQKNAQLNGEIQNKSRNLDVNDLLIYNSSDPRETNEKPLIYQLGLSVRAEKFNYDAFTATNFATEMQLKNDYIGFNNLNFLSCGGSFSGNAEWVYQNKNYLLKSSNTAKGININTLFGQFNNFGQTEFTTKNLFGMLTANTDLLVVWDDKFNLLTEKMLVLSDMTIKNGELLNYEPLNALSKFVDVNDLKNLKFSELKNTLTIKNKVLYVPTMDIHNNALNLNLTGTHTFENVLDYKIKLSLSELLSKKRKTQSNEFGEEDVKTRGINLFLSIKGPLSDLKFQFDRKGAKAQLKEDAKQEKDAIKEILKQEFGIKKDSTLKKIEKKNDNNAELEFEAN